MPKAVTCTSSLGVITTNALAWWPSINTSLLTSKFASFRPMVSWPRAATLSVVTTASGLADMQHEPEIMDAVSWLLFFVVLISVFLVVF
ncbi:hypothetical protein ACEPMY_01290 [Ralstonia pseudosolanacearum]|uniref:hypothetical protein n=1 Tax=Ralstonia pseudosolanacearum TaxID=1310165 RepID=UPI0038655DA1